MPIVNAKLDDGSPKHMRITLENMCLLAFAVAGLAVEPVAAQTNVQITVDGRSGPWDIALNPGYPYGGPVGGTPNCNLPPCVVDASTGLGFFAGDAMTIRSLTPGQATLLAGAGGSLWCDADGASSWGVQGPGSPAAYISGTLYLEELVGVFAFNGVIVGSPFKIGNGPVLVTVPAGANQLLLGMVDGWYNDNGGSVQVSISETVGAPVIRGIVHDSNAQVTLSLASVASSTNRLWAAASLVTPLDQWQVVATNTAGTNGLFQITDTNLVGVPQKYYRLSTP